MATYGAARKRESIAELHNQPLSKRAALVEILSLVILVEAIMWLAPFIPNQRIAYAVFALLIIALLAIVHIRDRITTREIGLRFDNFFDVLARLALPLILFIALVVGAGYAFGTLRFGTKFYSMLATVPLWALLQQYMLLAFCHKRLRLLVGEKRSAIATAALFSLLHLPNPVLTVVCAAGGYLWAREYDRSPNLIANAVTHTVASAFLANTLPGWLLKNMVVGYNYFLR